MAQKIPVSHEVWADLKFLTGNYQFFTEWFAHYRTHVTDIFSLPEKGVSKQDLRDRLNAYKVDDVDWKHGRNWSLVYYAGNDHADFVKEVYCQFFSENGAGPTMFPSLRRLESEVVAMVSALLGGGCGEVGTMTSGGTESIILAMRAYLEQARHANPGIADPEVLLPESAHPAVLKAAGYFGIKPVYIPLDSGFKADTDSIAELISDRTICMIASAPSFPHGIVDPVAEIARIASQYGLGLHVDACLGSFLLPFLKKSGRNIPDFDFSVPGVTSISADLHKNGYAAKGASVILYRSASLRRHQFFVDTQWPAGVYASPTMQGTRPGGAIAAAWASMMALGESGYLELAKRAIDATNTLIEGIEALPGLRVLGRPDMNVLAFISETLDIHALGSRLDQMGWRINRINNPPALHMIVTPNHEQAIKPFLHDLRKAYDEESASPNTDGKVVTAILYGGTEDVADREGEREQAIARLERQFEINKKP